MIKNICIVMPTIKFMIDFHFFNNGVKTKKNFKIVVGTKIEDKILFRNYIKRFAHEDCKKFKNPDATIDNYCRKKIVGYKQFNEKYNEINNLFQKEVIKYKKIYDDVINEFITCVKNKSKIKVCKNCGDIGHNANSNVCKHKIYEKFILKNKIKRFVLSINFFTDESINEHLTLFSEQNQLKLSVVKASYYTINPYELLERNINICDFMKTFDKTSINCHECKKKLYIVVENTNRMWKEQILCDKCWASHEKERDDMWKKINKKYKQICCICGNIKKYSGERFHFDHINMFEKELSVCTMVNNGYPIKKIYLEIEKSKMMCIRCHHLVTFAEKNFGFTSVKQQLTKKLNSGVITKEFHDKEKSKYEKKYEKMMNIVYSKLKKCLAK